MPNVNISKVYLLDVPLENDYKNTLYFTNKANQQAYFQSRIQKSYTDFSYQRKDFKIRVPDHIDSLYGCNYVMYQNSYYSNKWFYAFITKMEYIDDGRTDVYIETDVIQTWYFDYTVKASFVEREHTNDDEIGKNTTPEGLEIGEYVCNKHSQYEYGGSTQYGTLNYNIVVGTTVTLDGDDTEDVKGMLYDGIYSGVKYLVYGTSNEEINLLNSFLNRMAQKGKADAITCIFLAPEQIAILRNDHILAGSNTVRTHYLNHGEASTINKNIALSTNTLDGYIPRNHKLLTNPFRYLLVSNNNGADVVYNYEDFYTGSGDNKVIIQNPAFEINACITPGCSVRMHPNDYKGIANNHSEGINLGKYPIVNWASDVFTNWLTQNGVNIGLEVVGGIASTVAGGVSLAAAPVSFGASAPIGASMMVGGVNHITNAMAEVHKQSFAPPQSKGNLNCGDVVSAQGTNDFHFYDMSIKRQFAEMIDGFFDMFGYKTNKVKVPNKAHRSRWWYTKTIDVNIDGGVPNEDMQIIKNAYNNGITFWRNASEIQNYSLSNDIV